MIKAKKLVEDLIFLNRDEVISLIKIAQKDAIGNTLDMAVENAYANVDPIGDSIEAYVVASSILDLKQRLFKDVDE